MWVCMCFLPERMSSENLCWCDESVISLSVGLVADCDVSIDASLARQTVRSRLALESLILGVCACSYLSAYQLYLTSTTLAVAVAVEQFPFHGVVELSLAGQHHFAHCVTPALTQQ